MERTSEGKHRLVKVTSTSLVTDDAEALECVFCCETSDVTSGLRILPCNHIGCIECIKKSSSCSRCKYGIDSTKVEDMPKANIKEEAHENPAPPCDRCGNSPQPAATFCIDCGQTSCKKHKQFHDGYFGDSHDAVSIEEYVDKRVTYSTAVTCDDHSEETVKMACKQCYMMACVKCHVARVHRKPNHNHQYVPLAEIHEDLRAHYKAHLETVTNKLLMVSRNIKTLSKAEDVIKTKCEEMRKDVARKEEEQIQFIRQQSQNLRRKIDDYERSTSTSYHHKLSVYGTKETELDAVVGENTFFLQQSDIKQLITEKNERTQTMMAADISSLPTAGLALKGLRIGKKRKMEVDFFDNENDERNVAYYGSQRNFFGSDGEQWNERPRTSDGQNGKDDERVRVEISNYQVTNFESSPVELERANDIRARLVGSTSLKPDSKNQIELEYLWQ